MPNYLKRFDSHLLLEPKPNEHNSFIANVNMLAKYQNYLENLNLFLTEDTYKDFLELIANENLLPEHVNAIGDDLRKGTFRGKRQLAIDLVANMSAISTLSSFINSTLPQDLSLYTTSQLMSLVNNLSHSDLHTLYNTRTNRVYYDTITICTAEYTDGMTFSYTNNKALFNNDLIYNAQTLYNVLNNIKTTYPQGTNTTGFFINSKTGLVMENSTSSDGDDESRHYVVIYDNVSSATDGQSNITSIVLKEATQSVFNTVVSASSGTYSNRAIRSKIEYTWDDTTSALKVVSSGLNEVVEAANTIESNFAAMQETIEQASSLSSAIVDKAERLRNIRVATTPAAFTEKPSVTAAFTPDGASEQYTTLTFKLPSSGVALFDTSQFSIDNDGKLVLSAFAIDPTSSNQIISSSVNSEGTITITISPASD